MLFKRQKKSRKMRGSRPHGYGRVGKHRKSDGGKGNAGGLKHKKTWFMKYHPEHFGKLGMRFYHRKKNVEYCRSVGVENIFSYIYKSENFSEEKMNNQIPVVNFNDFGVHKVLGYGDISFPAVVVARSFTEEAQNKITKAGGKFIVSA